MLRSGGVERIWRLAHGRAWDLRRRWTGDGLVLMLAWCRNTSAGGECGWWNVDAFISVVNLEAGGDRSVFEEEMADCPTRDSQLPVARSRDAMLQVCNRSSPCAQGRGVFIVPCDHCRSAVRLQLRSLPGRGSLCLLRVVENV